MGLIFSKEDNKLEKKYIQLMQQQNEHWEEKYRKVNVSSNFRKLILENF